jgi:hypothetical protein
MATENFSLVLGGPLYQLYLRNRLARAPLDLLERRIAVFIVVGWLPLLVATTIAGTAFAGPKVPFVYDIEAHVRFLLVLPLLLVAEVLVHRRVHRVVEQFVERGIVAPEDRARFDAISESTLRLRNSMAVEIALLVASTFLGYWIWRQQIAAQVATWYMTPDPAGGRTLTAAGWWYAFVSLNLLRFILFRWYYRLVIWYVFLWRVARLPLRLNALHPDGAAGLGFLAGSLHALTPLMFAQTVMAAGTIAGHILNEGMALPAFRVEIAGILVFVIALAVLPLIFFSPAIWRARRQDLRAYGMLSMRYVDEFRDKWIRGTPPPDERLVGSGDIQSLADLGNAFEAVSRTGVLPVRLRAIFSIAVIVALPFLPLTLTMIPFEELLDRLLNKLL